MSITPTKRLISLLLIFLMIFPLLLSPIYATAEAYYLPGADTTASVSDIADTGSMRLTLVRQDVGNPSLPDSGSSSSTGNVRHIVLYIFLILLGTSYLVGIVISWVWKRS